MSQNYIPIRDSDFNQWFKNLNQYVNGKCTGTPPAWTHIPADERSAMEGSYTAWSTAYENALNTATRTKVDVEAKQDARKASEQVIRSFVNRFLREDWTVVSHEDRTAMNIPNHDHTPTPHPAPSIAPVLEVLPSGQRKHLATAINPVTNTKQKPALVKGVAFAHKVRRTEEPKAGAEEMPSEFQAAAVREFQWAEGDYGKVVDYAAAYENESGKRGPWSNVVSVIIA